MDVLIPVVLVRREVEQEDNAGVVGPRSVARRRDTPGGPFSVSIAGLILTTVRTMISSRPKTFGEQDDLEGIHLRLRRGAGTIPWILAVGEIFRPALHHRVTHLESQRSWPRTARIKCRLIARKQKQSLAF